MCVGVVVNLVMILVLVGLIVLFDYLLLVLFLGGDSLVLLIVEYV